jgi:hypothetical protein
LVPVENQGSYTHPTVAEVASPFLSSLSDAKSKLQPTSKIARKCTAFLRLQPLNSPTRFREDPKELAMQPNSATNLPGGFILALLVLTLLADAHLTVRIREVTSVAH